MLRVDLSIDLKAWFLQNVVWVFGKGFIWPQSDRERQNPHVGSLCCLPSGSSPRWSSSVCLLGELLVSKDEDQGFDLLTFGACGIALVQVGFPLILGALAISLCLQCSFWLQIPKSQLQAVHTPTFSQGPFCFHHSNPLLARSLASSLIPFFLKQWGPWELLEAINIPGSQKRIGYLCSVCSSYLAQLGATFS